MATPDRTAKKRITGLVVGELSIVDYGANLKEYLVTKGQDGRRLMEITEKAKKLAQLAKHLEEGIAVLKGFAPEGDAAEGFNTAVKALTDQVEGLKAVKVEEADSATESLQGVSKAVTDALAVLKEITEEKPEGFDTAVKSLEEANAGFSAAVEALTVEKAGAAISKARLEKLKGIAKTLQDGAAGLTAFISEHEPEPAAKSTEEPEPEPAAKSPEAPAPEATTEEPEATTEEPEIATKALTDLLAVTKDLAGAVGELRDGQKGINERIDGIESAVTTSKAAEGDPEPAAKRSPFSGFLFKGTGKPPERS